MIRPAGPRPRKRRLPMRVCVCGFLARVQTFSFAVSAFKAMRETRLDRSIELKGGTLRERSIMMCSLRISKVVPDESIDNPHPQTTPRAKNLYPPL